MKVALVYDRINKWGGAERVLLALHKIFKDAPLYTSVYSKKNTPWADVFDIRPSFLQKITGVYSSHEFLAPLMPLAFESMSFDDFDAVISVTSEAAKGVLTKPKTMHICICLTPTRYLWSGYNDYFRNKTTRKLSKPLVSSLRAWDKTAAQRPDYMIAISENVRQRINKYYGRDSVVIYPPAESLENTIQNNHTDFIQKDKKSKTQPKDKNLGYFLVVSRLVHYKRIDIAIKAFNKINLPLKIIGIGRDFNRLKRLAKKNIEFLGNLTDEKLSYYYQNARALVFPGIEDFGLTMVEAQLSGVPVIAFGQGGAVEIVKKGETGEFFKLQDHNCLIRILEKFDEKRYNSKNCRKNGERFLFRNFERNFTDFFNVKVKEYFK